MAVRELDNAKECLGEMDSEEWTAIERRWMAETLLEVRHTLSIVRHWFGVEEEV